MNHVLRIPELAEHLGVPVRIAYDLARKTAVTTERSAHDSTPRVGHF